MTKIAPGLAFNFTPQDQTAGAAMPEHEREKKKKKAAAAGATDTNTGGSSPGMAPMHTMHGTHGMAIIAGIVIVAAVGTTVGVLATSGESTPAQGVSPSRP